MINFGFTASTAGIGQAGGNPAAQSLVQRTNDMSGANAGFFGMLLALFARPVGTDQPVMPEGGTARFEGDTAKPETGQIMPAPDGSGAPNTVIVSGDLNAPGTTIAAPAGHIPGGTAPVPAGDSVITEPLIPETRIPAGSVSDAAVPAGDSVITEPLIPETRSSAGSVSDAAGPAGDSVITEPLIPETRIPAGGVSDAAVPAGDSGITEPMIPETRSSAGSDSDEIDALLTQVRGHQLKALQGSIKWATDLQPAGKNAIGDIPLWNINRLSGAPEQLKLAPVEGRGNAALPALNMEPRAETEPQNRISGFFTNELFRVSANTELLPQGRTLEAFARMAEGCEALRQTVLGDDTAQVTNVISGQGVASTEKANGVSLTTANGEAALASLMKMASARRVEPVTTREDLEDAFIFGAPQETVLSGGKDAPVEDVWAKAVVSRVHDETVDAKAAGKTSVSFDITTESGEIVRVRIAMRNNLVSGRIGVMDSGTREILALHIPELNQRLEMENLIPERFDVYVMNGDGEGGRRGQDRKAKQAAGRSDEQKDEDDFIYVSSEPKTFEKWA